MWSVIIRFSIDSDIGSKVRNKLAPLLQNAGFTQFGGNTGSWRIDATNPIDAAKTMSDLIAILANPLGTVTNADPATITDHIWIYVERSNESIKF